MMHQSILRRFHITASILFSCAVFAGCSSDDGRVEVLPISGMVTSNGKPAEGVILQLVPAEGSIAKAAGLFPGGVSDSNGVYRLTTYKPGDGAPEGEYKVRLYWPGPAKEVSSDPVKAAMQNNVPGGPEDRYRFKYWKKPESNPWGVVVAKGTTEAMAIELPAK
jgi:hypothetical protein